MNLLYVAGFLGLMLLLVWIVFRVSTSRSLRRLRPDPVDQVIEGAFFARLGGDICLTRSQLVYVAMAMYNPQVSPLAMVAGPGLIGAALADAKEKQLAAQRDKVVASLLDDLAKIRAKERDQPLAARLRKHPYCRVLDRPTVKSVERTGNTVVLRCLRPKSLEYVLPDEGSAGQAEALLRGWIEGRS
jgi:hypothetical protein